MDYIINRILEILKENNISVYYLSKLTGISNSTLHKILHFERTMKPKHFYAIIDNLPLSLTMEKDLTDRFQQVSLGIDTYSANKYIYEMLKNFSKDSFSQFNSKLPPPVYTSSAQNTSNTVTVYKGAKVGSVINFSLIDEMNKDNPYAYIYVPGNSDKISAYIDSTINLYETDIKIIFLIDFLNNYSNFNTNYNLQVLRNIIPIMLSPLHNYSFYYTYVNTIINESYTSPYPYFIVLSDKVILINVNFDEIVVINDTVLAQNYTAICKAKLTKYKKLIEGTSDIVSIVGSIVSDQVQINTHYCIEYEPCLAFYFTKEMICSVVPEDVNGRDMLIDVLYKRLEQIQNMKNSIQIFNKDSLIQFAETGIINEFPSEFSRPCNPAERLYLLQSLLKAMDTDNHIIRALNPVNFEISDCLSLIVQDNQYLQFSIFNDRKLPLQYYKINEISICTCFSNFIKNLIDTNIVYSKKETKAFVEEAIAFVEKL